MVEGRGKAFYAKHYREYQGKPEQIAARSERNKARQKLIKEGKAHVGDGKDVHHKKDISAGGTNARSNLVVASRAVNRGHWKGKKR